MKGVQQQISRFDLSSRVLGALLHLLAKKRVWTLFEGWRPIVVV